MKLYNVISILLIVGVLLVSGCTQQGTQPTTSDKTVQTALTGEVKEFTMTAKRFEFVPNTITVSQGDRVKLTITSTDVTHGFNLPAFGINERLEPNKKVEVEFVADKTGTFTFTCSVPCGSGHGRMSGQLVVE